MLRKGGRGREEEERVVSEKTGGIGREKRETLKGAGQKIEEGERIKGLVGGREGKEDEGREAKGKRLG